MKTLQLSINSKGYIKNHESDYLEFKKAFQKPKSEQFSDNSRTFAGFANSCGGYIVYGIENSPHRPVGINDKWYESDPKEITEFLQNHFYPEIIYKQFDYDISVDENTITFGVIQVFESNFKPVICKQVDNKNKLKINAVYKRYGALTCEIKPEDYILLLQIEREKEREKWFKLFEKIGKVGIENIGLMNLTNGEISGNKGNFYIDESLLPQLKFINEGHFVENNGAPALKLIGNLVSVNVIKREEIGKAINTPEIIRAFLNRDVLVNHIEYLKQITNESSANLPIYFFLKNCGQSKEEIKAMIKDQKTTHKLSKIKLLDRLDNDESFTISKLDTGTKSSIKINTFLQDILNQNINLSSIDINDWLYFLKAFTHLNKEQINDYTFNLLIDFFDSKFDSLKKSEPDAFRRAICHIDQILFEN